MRATTALKLCAASAVAGAAIAPPAARKAKRETAKALRRGAVKYVEAREKVRKAARKTGKPGQVIAATARMTGHGAAEMAHRWRGLVRQAERERVVAAPKPELGATVPGPVMKIGENAASRN